MSTQGKWNNTPFNGDGVNDNATTPNFQTTGGYALFPHSGLQGYLADNKKRHLIGPYRRPMPRVLGGS